MSGLEVLGIVASVIQIADVGARLSVKLLAFNHKIKNADANIKNISHNIAIIYNVLRELDTNLKKDEQNKLYNKNTIKTAENVIKECIKIFKDFNGALDGKIVGNDEKEKKSVLKKIKRNIRFSLIKF